MIARGLCVLTVTAIAVAEKPPRKERRFFDDRVAPILIKNCLGCHNHELDDGDISFENRATLLKKRRVHGPAVVPGHPEHSALIRAIRHDGDAQMPPGRKLSPQDIATLTEWVKRGAVWGAKLRTAAGLR